MRVTLYNAARQTDGIFYPWTSEAEIVAQSREVIAYRVESEKMIIRDEVHGAFNAAGTRGVVTEIRQYVGRDLHVTFEYDERIDFQTYYADLDAAVLTGVVFTGNRFANALDGFGGPDRMSGGAGGDLLDGLAGNDRIFGGLGADRLRGGDGRDRIEGGAGRDRIDGGAGRDALAGGAGADALTGGGGADVFLFRNAADAGRGRTRDAISDFRSGVDTIDFHLIDANENRRGNQMFRFIEDDAFSHSPGEIRYAGGVVYADTDGDRAADFALRIDNLASLTADDFVF